MRKNNAGRKRIDPLILFKMLVLQQVFNSKHSGVGPLRRANARLIAHP
jgi:hypothetical protein